MPSSSCRSVPLRGVDRVSHPRVGGDAHAVPQYLATASSHVKKYEVWASSFRSTLEQAKEQSRDLDDPGFVWQDELVEFWLPFTSIQRDLFALFEEIRRASPSLADLLEPYIDPPSFAQIEYATEGAKFLDRINYDRKQIAYDLQRLGRWHEHFTGWVQVALRELTNANREI